MKKLYIIILIGILFAGCKREVITVEQLEGNWNWIESTGGNDGVTQTPQSIGITLKLTITSTNIKKYIDGDLITDLTYTMETTESIHGGEKEIITYENDWKQSVEFEDGNLILTDECFDCFRNVYEK